MTRRGLLRLIEQLETDVRGPDWEAKREGWRAKLLGVVEGFEAEAQFMGLTAEEDPGSGFYKSMRRIREIIGCEK